jgi:SPP1 gp7 family putative phage head morphogenesis protein
MVTDMTFELFDEPLEEDPNRIIFRTFEEYREKALQVHQLYNEVWLTTEYQFTVQSGISARRWNEIKYNFGQFDAVLKYKTVGDSRVRKEHKRINNTTLPMLDPWWKKHYPPNGWNCRCDVIQVFGKESEKISNNPNILTPEELPDIFNNNVGENGIIFPPSHPYYNN